MQERGRETLRLHARDTRTNTNWQLGSVSRQTGGYLSFYQGELKEVRGSWWGSLAPDLTPLMAGALFLHEGVRPRDRAAQNPHL